MADRQSPRWPWLILLMFISGACSGVLAEQQHADGTVERIRVHGMQTWKIYDHNPQKKDDSGLILKKETTF